jgi:hypothetical protein
MPMPATGTRKFTRAQLFVNGSREILIEDLSIDVSNESEVVTTDGAVGTEDDTAPAKFNATWQVKVSSGNIDYLTPIITPGQRNVEMTIRTADGTYELFGVLNSSSEKQPRGVGHNRSIAAKGIVTAYVRA